MSTFTNKSLYDRIVFRKDQTDNDYAKVNHNRDVMTTYFRSDEIIDTDDKGELVGQAIYNGSGSWYGRTMATAFQGSMVSKNTDWFRYMFDILELKGIDELDIWTQNVKEHMTGAYQKGNFYDVQPQFTYDGLTTGSPLMFAEEDVLEEKIMWMPQHYKNVRLYYDKFNVSEGVIILDKTWTAKKIFDMFVKEDDTQWTKSQEILPISVVNALRQGRYNDTFTMYRATFKVTDPIWDGTDEAGESFKKPQGGWNWLTAYFLELTTAELSKKNKPLNKNMGDFSKPYTVWNFDKKPWEPSSRTPAWYALWDCLSLQQIDKNYLEDVQNANRRAFIALDTMKNNVNLDPEGEMWVTQNEYDNPPKFLDKVGCLTFERELIEMKEEALKRWFFIDKLSMFSELAIQKNQPPSATQIIQMAGEKATLLSPAIETHSRYLETADARMVDIEFRAGRGPFAPAVMANITDIIQSNLTSPVKSVNIVPVFIGQLAQAQKVAQALKPIQSTMGVTRELMDMNPQLRHKYRWYELAGKVEDAFDFPQDVIVPKEEYDKRVAAENEAAAQQQQFENTMEAMKNSKNLGSPVDETSILARAVG